MVILFLKWIDNHKIGIYYKFQVIWTSLPFFYCRFDKNNRGKRRTIENSVIIFFCDFFLLAKDKEPQTAHSGQIVWKKTKLRKIYM